MKNQTLWTVIGAVAGLVLVRYYFLDVLQVAGYKMFMEGHMDFLKAMQSATMLKMTTGGLVGGVLGWFVLGKNIKVLK